MSRKRVTISVTRGDDLCPSSHGRLLAVGRQPPGLRVRHARRRRAIVWVRRVSARPVLCGLYGLLVGYTDGEVEVHDLPVAVLMTKDGGEPRRQAAASGKAKRGRSVPHPTDDASRRSTRPLNAARTSPLASACRAQIDAACRSHVPGMNPSCIIRPATSGWELNCTIFPSLTRAK
jgi:hypothetical protein